MKLVYQYMKIFFTFPPTSNHLHPLQVENCDSNSRLVVEEDDNGKFRPETVKGVDLTGFPVNRSREASVRSMLTQHWLYVSCSLGSLSESNYANTNLSNVQAFSTYKLSMLHH